VEEKVVKAKLAKELSTSSLQSPDDLGATFVVISLCRWLVLVG
jgi:hypothetical protein